MCLVCQSKINSIINKQYLQIFLYGSKILLEESVIFFFKPRAFKPSCYQFTPETSLWVVATLAGQMRTTVIN